MCSEYAKKLFAECLTAGGAGVLVGVSGGADSLGLLHLAAQVCGEGGVRVVVGHVEHGLRGEDSRGDCEFVRQQAGRLGLEFVAAAVDVRRYASEEGLSIETAGRLLRRRELVRMTCEHGCGVIATGHHADDNAETLLHRLRRGTGFRGLAGIRPCTVQEGIRWIRPLLGVTRGEMEQYCRERGLAWREDATNRDVRHTRNWIRHRLVPYLQEGRGEPVAELLGRLAAAGERLVSRLEVELESRWTDLVLDVDHNAENRDSAAAGAIATRIGLDAATFVELGPLLQGEAVRRVLGRMGAGLRDMDQAHFERVAALAAGARRRRLDLPGPIRVRRDFGQLVFEQKGSEARPPADSAIPLPVPGRVEMDGRAVETRICSIETCDLPGYMARRDLAEEWFDADCVVGPLTLRPANPDEIFHPLGYKRPVRIGRFLTSARVDAAARERLLAVADGEKILWLCPLRPGNEARITPKTQQVLQVRLIPAERVPGGILAAKTAR